MRKADLENLPLTGQIEEKMAGRKQHIPTSVCLSKFNKRQEFVESPDRHIDVIDLVRHPC